MASEIEPQEVCLSGHPSELVAQLRIGLWHLPFSDPGRILSYHNFTSHTEHSATVLGRLSQIHTGQEESWQAECNDLILFGFLMLLPGAPICYVVGLILKQEISSEDRLTISTLWKHLSLPASQNNSKNALFLIHTAKVKTLWRIICGQNNSVGWQHSFKDLGVKISTNSCTPKGRKFCLIFLFCAIDSRLSEYCA